MPILNARVHAETRDGQGDSVVSPRGLALVQAGPRVRVTLSPLAEQIGSPTGGREDVPARVVGDALIDTGASVTCIDGEAAVGAGLAVVDSGPVHSATHANETVPIYAGLMNIHGLSNVETRRAYGVNLVTQGLTALIGRDVLSNCILVYNGADNSFSLSL